ncbi:MAG: DUF4147 domain-containing protein [Rhodobacteraceae bacterium]|nr:DUF4147 domain-containing protein [Paracoccaceae bacterium]
MEISEMRSLARLLYDVAVAAADPGPAVEQWLADNFVRTAGRLIVLALGKAAPAMARAAMGQVAADRAVCVTNKENAMAVEGAEVIIGGHPIPDNGSVRAGAALLEAVRGLGPDDQVLVLISGGGSALAIAPVEGVTAQEKAEVSRQLLASGSDISQMNMVRQNLSRLKGGGLARAAVPAQVTTLILSDVIGDDLSVVASGPTVAAGGDRVEALAFLQDKGLLTVMPQAVRSALSAAGPAGAENACNYLIGSNRVSLEAMATACPGAVIVDDALTGDVADAAARILAVPWPGVLLFGGETTVRPRGDGRGGRNQELALRVALSGAALGQNWVFLSGGTDGRDGPTDAAGGLVDPGSIARMRAAGADPQALLANNDSYAALAASGDLLMTGGTGTNVADVQVLVVDVQANRA